MNDATASVRHWQQLLTPFMLVLTQPGNARFAQWVTDTALGWEEHMIIGSGFTGVMRCNV